jgi:glycosyltransferase involved in cell wall biosynthesis
MPAGKGRRARRAACDVVYLTLFVLALVTVYSRGLWLSKSRRHARLADSDQLLTCKVAIVTTFKPTKCGIATFSEALIHGMKDVYPFSSSCSIHVVALSKMRTRFSDPIVAHSAVISGGYPSLSLNRAANFISAHFTHAIFQHEFGLTPNPSQYMQLVNSIAPSVFVLTVFHTPSSYPTVAEQHIVHEMTRRANASVVMTWRGWHNLISTYGVDRHKMHFVPHGVDAQTDEPPIDMVPVQCQGRRIILSNGIIHPHKGIDRVIRILPRLMQLGLNPCYIIAGTVNKNHPRTMDNYLELARVGRISKSIFWINRFLSKSELSYLLRAATVFAALYDDVIPTSGTVLAAMAHGLPVVATEFRFASEVLSAERGILVPFDDDDATAEAFHKLLSSNETRERIGTRSSEFVRNWTWKNVARQYASLLNGTAPKPLSPDPFIDEFALYSSKWYGGVGILLDGSRLDLDGRDGEYALFVSRDVQINAAFRAGVLVAATLQSIKWNVLASVHTVDFEKTTAGAEDGAKVSYYIGRFFAWSNGVLSVNLSLAAVPEVALLLRCSPYFYPRGILGHSIRTISDTQYRVPVLDVLGDWRLPSGGLFSIDLPSSATTVPPVNIFTRNKPRSDLPVVIEGPFFDESGFAQVNRRMWRVLVELGYRVFISPEKHSYQISTTFTSALLRLSKEAHEAQGVIPSDRWITIRNQWPPNFKAPKRGLLIQNIPWEFGTIPAMWVRRLGTASEIWAPSEYNAAVFRKAGVRAPVFVLPHAVITHPRVASPRENRYVFLFHGGLLARKGIDVLLRAYIGSFRASDSVTLLIHSTYGNYFLDDIQRAVYNNSLPKVLLDRRVLSTEGVASLYATTDALVAPFRGEGFGLPILEGLQAGTRVITTRAGPATEICDDGCTYIDAEEVPCRVDPCGRLKIFGMRTKEDPTWFEPSEDHLKRLLLESYGAKSPRSTARDYAKFSVESLAERIEKRLQAHMSKRQINTK